MSRRARRAGPLPGCTGPAPLDPACNDDIANGNLRSTARSATDREADLAIDFREDVPALPREAVARIVAVMESEGLTAKVSSIHVNGWFGGYDKLSTSRLLLAEEFGIDLDTEKESLVFVGDSPNDQPMFACFPNAVGVANVAKMADLMTSLPRYVTPSEGSRGFAELADAILLARGQAQ